ncbi:MAG: hypothetical protein K0R63_1372 [Rickettsiales bacterium]|jgi:16S rRNA (uracil1498-N3)-methyltransferase|nr:hypothetical protein [Rickettsiales bacterium]
MRHIARLYVESLTSPAPGQSLTLPPEQSHYLVNVMRQEEGAILHIFHPEHGEWEATLIHAHKKHTGLSLGKQRRQPSPEPDVWLLFAPVKNAALQTIVEKATELGVSGLQPVITEHTIAHKVNTEKLEIYAIEAAEQCERLSIPTIFPPASLESVLAGWSRKRKLIFCDESGEGNSAQETLSTLPKGEPYAVLIGPEGGFSMREQEHLRQLPFSLAIGLGPRILRADTAAITALSCLQMHIGDWDKQPRFKK